jgi:hypothetical protein
MIDKRVKYKMEQGYCRSDYSFYASREDTVDAYAIFDTLQRANDEWTLVYSYIHKGRFMNETVLVLDNGKGTQVESSAYGWKRVVTEHDKKLHERKLYQEFIAQLAAINPPSALRRWHSDMIESLETEFEEILYYGDEE